MSATLTVDGQTARIAGWWDDSPLGRRAAGTEGEAVYRSSLKYITDWDLWRAEVAADVLDGKVTAYDPPEWDPKAIY